MWNHVDWSIVKIASRPKCVCVTHLILTGLGDDGSLCPGLLLFANLGKKFRISPGGSPCPSVGDYLTGCTACTNAKKKREYCRNPSWDAPKVSWGPALWRDSYPAKGDWGRHGVKIRALKETWRFLVTLAKSCTFPPYKKTKQKNVDWSITAISSFAGVHNVKHR